MGALLFISYHLVIVVANHFLGLMHHVRRVRFKELPWETRSAEAISVAVDTSMKRRFGCCCCVNDLPSIVFPDITLSMVVDYY